MSARKRCDAGECGRMDWERRIAELEAALHDIHRMSYMSGDNALHSICARAAGGLGFDALKKQREREFDVMTTK